MAKPTNEERTKQLRGDFSTVATEQYESQLSISSLDRYYVYVDYLTYLDICISESTVTLNHPVTSFAENPSLAITTNGNFLTSLKASTLEDTGNLGKNSIQGPATSIKPQAEAHVQNKLEENGRRDLQ